MAADVYLLIESVNGEFNDDKHRGWIEVHAVDWGVTQPTAGTVSTAGGHTIGRAVFDAIRITKDVDLAHPTAGKPFWNAAAGGYNNYRYPHLY